MFVQSGSVDWSGDIDLDYREIKDPVKIAVLNVGDLKSFPDCNLPLTMSNLLRCKVYVDTGIFLKSLCLKMECAYLIRDDAASRVSEEYKVVGGSQDYFLKYQ